MQRPKLFVLAAGSLLGLIILAGCGAGASDSSGFEAKTVQNSASAAQAAESSVHLASTLQAKGAEQKKIIYNAQADLGCENLDKASQALLALVRRLGGYIGNASSGGSKGSEREATYTVRIPVEHYDELFNDLSSIGEIERTEQKAEDVSEEYYDAAARLKNKQVEEDRLISLLQNHSGHLTDILALEKELSRVREEIERIQGRIRYLSNQSAMSTVTIALREIKEFVPKGSPSIPTQAGRAFLSSVTEMRDAGVALLVFGAGLTPWIVPLAVVVIVAWRSSRRKGKQAQVPPPTA